MIKPIKKAVIPVAGLGSATVLCLKSNTVDLGWNACA